MLSPLPESLASVAVNTCLRIKASDVVTILFNDHSTKLAEEIAIECFKNGADVLLNLYTDRYYLGYLTHLSEESLRQPSVWCRELDRNSTAQFWLGAIYDPNTFRGISARKLAADREGESKAHLPKWKGHKVRSLIIESGKPTEPRSKAYGLNHTEFQTMMNAASRVDPRSLTKTGREVSAKLRTSEKIHITSPNGTDLELSVKGRRVTVNDGIVDQQDIAEGTLTAVIPAGSVEVAVLEDSGNGRLVLDVPTPWADDFFLPARWTGRMIRKLSWTFEDGRVTSFKGDKNAEALRREWEASSGDKDRIAVLSIGLNPKAKAGFLANRIVRGAIGIAIGGNTRIGGANDSGFFYLGTLAKATLEADGNVIVHNSKLTT